MGIASLILGIFAAILAAIATAPCFGMIAVPAALFAFTGLLLGIAEFANVAIRKTRAVAVDPEAISAARTGSITNGIALAWSVGLFFIKYAM